MPGAAVIVPGLLASCLTPALTFEPTGTASSSGSSTRAVVAEKCLISPEYFSGHHGFRVPPRAVSLAKILFRLFYFGERADRGVDQSAGSLKNPPVFTAAMVKSAS